MYTYMYTYNRHVYTIFNNHTCTHTGKEDNGYKINVQSFNNHTYMYMYTYTYDRKRRQWLINHTTYWNSETWC